MRTRFDRVTGVAAAALILLGWTLGSTLMPPVARSEGQPSPAPRARPIAALAVPRLQLPLRRGNVAAPHAARNPFAFERATAALSGALRSAPPPSAAAREEAAIEAAAAAAAPVWQLAGIALGPGTDLTAVVSGAGGVHLVHNGDTLPGGWQVRDVTADAVRLVAPDGAERTLVLR